MNKAGNIDIHSTTVLISGLYFILCFFILPDNLARKCIVIFAIPLLLILHRMIVKPNFVSEYTKLCLAVAVAIIAMLPALFSLYGQKYTLDLWIYIFLSFLLFGMKYDTDETLFEENNSIRLLICWCSLLVLMYYCFIHTDYTQGDLAFTAYNNDKNYAAFIVFLLFMIYMKLRFLPGIVFPIFFFVFCNKSRGLILCMMVFIAIRFGKKCLKQVIKIRHGYTLLFCVVSTLAIIGFSYLFIYGTAFSTIGGYRDTLVDGSNKMRFNANIYAIDLIRDNKLIWSGLGSDLTRYMGVDDGMGNNMVNLQYNGFRLVQSHDSVINIITRIGIIPTLLYLFVMGLIADKYKTYENLEYYYSFLVYGLILNYYFGPWIIAWFFVLYLRPVKAHKKSLIKLI